MRLPSAPYARKGRLPLHRALVAAHNDTVKDLAQRTASEVRCCDSALQFRASLRQSAVSSNHRPPTSAANQPGPPSLTRECPARGCCGKGDVKVVSTTDLDSAFLEAVERTKPQGPRRGQICQLSTPRAHLPPCRPVRQHARRGTPASHQHSNTLHTGVEVGRTSVDTTSCEMAVSAESSRQTRLLSPHAPAPAPCLLLPLCDLTLSAPSPSRPFLPPHPCVFTPFFVQFLSQICVSTCLCHSGHV